MLHGTSGHLEAFLRNVAPHAEHYAVHAIDMLGHGWTGKPDHPYEIPRYVEHLLAYLDAVGAPRAHLVGESLGGWVAAWLASEHPDRVASLQLLASGGTKADPVIMDRIKGSTTRAVTTDDRAFTRARLELLMHDPADVSEELVDVRHAIYHAPDFVRNLPNLLCLQEMEVRQRNLLRADRLARISAPTLVVWGRRTPSATCRRRRRCTRRSPGRGWSCSTTAGTGRSTSRPRPTTRSASPSSRRLPCPSARDADPALHADPGRRAAPRRGGQRGHAPAAAALDPALVRRVRRAAAAARPRTRVLAMDTLGFGASPPLAEHSIEAYAAGALALLDALGIERVALLGHHTGGVVALELAACAPDRVERLVLSSTPWTDAAFRRRREGHPPIDLVEVAEDGSHLTELWQRRQGFYPPGRPDLLTRFVRDALVLGPDVERGHRAVGAYRMEERVGPRPLPGAAARRVRRPLRLPRPRAPGRGPRTSGRRRDRRRHGPLDGEPRRGGRRAGHQVPA
jgi:2-hydroxy-6-oxonona-2,4-dienedioate hydrolase